MSPCVFRGGVRYCRGEGGGRGHVLFFIDSTWTLSSVLAFGVCCLFSSFPALPNSHLPFTNPTVIVLCCLGASDRGETHRCITSSAPIQLSWHGGYPDRRKTSAMSGLFKVDKPGRDARTSPLSSRAERAKSSRERSGQKLVYSRTV